MPDSTECSDLLTDGHKTYRRSEGLQSNNHLMLGNSIFEGSARIADIDMTAVLFFEPFLRILLRRVDLQRQGLTRRNHLEQEREFIAPPVRYSTADHEFRRAPDSSCCINSITVTAEHGRELGMPAEPQLSERPLIINAKKRLQAHIRSPRIITMDRKYAVHAPPRSAAVIQPEYVYICDLRIWLLS